MFFAQCVSLIAPRAAVVFDQCAAEMQKLVGNIKASSIANPASG